jgi:hypothetical protein
VADNTAYYRGFETSYKITNNNLDQHQGIGGVAPADRKKLADEFLALDRAIKARDWSACLVAFGNIETLRTAQKATANRHGDYIGKLNNLKLRVTALQSHPNAAAIQTEIATIKKSWVEAAEKEYAKGNKYVEAVALLTKGDQGCTTAKAKADMAGKVEFDKRKDELNKRIAKLKAPPNTEVAREEVKDLEARVARADTIAKTKNYRAALDALKAEAKRKVEAGQAATIAVKAVAGSDKDAKSALEGAAAVQKMHDQLLQHPQAAVIKAELASVQSNINNAKKAAA